MEDHEVLVEKSEPTHYSSGTTLRGVDKRSSNGRLASTHLSCASTLPGNGASQETSNAFEDPILDEKAPAENQVFAPALAYLPPEKPENPFDDSNISSVFGDAQSEKARLEDQIYRARRRNRWLTPPWWLSIIGQLLGYLLLACAVYFFLIGYPLWHGAVYNFW